MDETEKRLLRFLGEKGAVITGMIMTALGLDEKAVNGVLRDLEAKGYVEFLQDVVHGDREVVTAQLTGEGTRWARDDLARGSTS